ncbi:response regulator [Halopseudomonas salegens]|uniref:histidine kinase n=1 Tax=Halopseudomonas salegens TaxID=1434072 RepID=A0A1H2EEW6_9GAMM|nr:response regulator [Halopseudomonas salegens]SDT93584.1 two-component system, NarL family, sensor histidine kinase BarA [Halopseudomonas salegens]
MNNTGLKARILLITLIPAGLLVLSLGSYFSWQYLKQLDEQLMERGLLGIEYLQRPATRALLVGEPESVQPYLDGVLNRTDVRAVSLHDRDMQSLQHAGPLMQPTDEPVTLSHLGQGTGLQIHSGQYSSRFLLPLLASPELLNNQSQVFEVDELLGWLELELSHGNTRLLGYQTLLTTLLLCLFGLSLASLLAYTLTRRITAPLSAVNHAVRKLSEGQLDVRLPTQGSREMDDLAQGINTMAKALYSAQGELQQNIDQATEDLRQTLETIEIQNIELDLARKTAQEASRVKSEFLANMSHELRTPLNGILGFTNLLQRTQLNPRQKDYLGTIEKSADNLLSIINEILDFSKIEAGKLVLDNLAFNLRDLIQDTLTMLAPGAHQKDLELVSIIYRDTPLGLSGDPLRLKQILANLLSNAIKFTGKGSVCVRTMLEQQDGSQVVLRISITDTGIGLSQSQQKSLFQAFSQADNSASRQVSGTGLGLVIAKRLVEQMHGEIGLNSEPGQGSEFWLTVRLNIADQATDDLPIAPWTGTEVALVEPHELTRQALLHNLEDLGCTVLVLDDLSALQQRLLQQPPGTPLLTLVSSQQHNASSAEVNGQIQRWIQDDRCRCLLMTHTQEHFDDLENWPADRLQVLAKPICLRKLHQACNQLLNGPQPGVRRTERNMPLAGIRVLCVDDNPANLKLVTTFLDELGARVLAAGGGEEALQISKEQPVDIIFMDVQMPGMDGPQTTAELRLREEQAGLEPVPVIALTAHALAHERRQLLKCGMNDYLSKPTNPEQLLQCIQKWTGQQFSDSAADILITHTAAASGARNESSVLDPREGLRLAAGKPELARDMLAMLLASLDQEYSEISHALTNNDPEHLLERIHRLHGASRYCGVPDLRQHCLQTETLLKNDEPANLAVRELLAAIRRLQQAATETSFL